MLLILLFLFLSINSPVFASQEFTLNQKINYQIDNQGNAFVTQESELINNYSEIYPQNYQITISSSNISNITSNDNFGNILQKTEKVGDQTQIYLKFNQASIGKNQITKFSLNYTIPKFATQKGNTWEISLPDFQQIQNQDSVSLTILLPSTFGNLSFASSAPNQINNLNQQTQIFFNTENVKNKNILLIFGDYQLFDFNLKYFLNNQSNSPKTQQIAIPPQTDSQKITYQKINPQPKNIIIDQDGNWLAEYQLSPNQKLEINISGQAKIIHSNQTLAEINQSLYLNQKTYWPIQNQDLIQIAQTLNTPKDIFYYVVNQLGYKTSNFELSYRKGADQALLNPNDSLCTEFTDLFITLARIKGIPAREVQGFAYTNNQKIKPINEYTDILHAWPQYYDFSKKAWISVDPTWTKTTSGVDFFNDLDPNHIAFVFHGLDSQNPITPGSYKDNQNIKTIEINFSKTELASNYLPLEIKNISSSIFKNQTIQIYNPNLNAITNLNFKTQNSNWSHHINLIAPLSFVKITLPKNNFSPKINIIVNSDNNQKANFSLNNHHFYFNLIIILGIIITLIGFGGIIFKRKR